MYLPSGDQAMSFTLSVWLVLVYSMNGLVSEGRMLLLVLCVPLLRVGRLMRGLPAVRIAPTTREVAIPRTSSTSSSTRPRLSQPHLGWCCPRVFAGRYPGGVEAVKRGVDGA